MVRLPEIKGSPANWYGKMIGEDILVVWAVLCREQGSYHVLGKTERTVRFLYHGSAYLVLVSEAKRG
jgi:hypothetical protein